MIGRVSSISTTNQTLEESPMPPVNGSTNSFKRPKTTSAAIQDATSKCYFLPVSQNADVLAVNAEFNSQPYGSKPTNGSERRQKIPSQKRYEPDTPMTKEEESAWRKEQRKIRNRKSAADSRQRARNRISELEGEVEKWKVKYEAAIAKLRDLEKGQDQSKSSPPQNILFPCQSYVTPKYSPPSPLAFLHAPFPEFENRNHEKWVNLDEKEHLNETVSRQA
eukprot:CAMPEP_0195508986 /NCGR_PEP_ID=MMETSP0794_2-20130614/2042_1 /TAXON_ID=515487 /ORGANISM="Stephanopyxis turris, Strain CCMP 815" /LENGTH=220 /DNA_ID=CAMNT_0040636091 /DNA_START=127 /DNA_END=789 /DNA_ORIENTATION=+